MVRTVVAERGEGGWLAMDEHGNVTLHSTADDLVGAVRKRDKLEAKGGDLVVTAIEWCE